MLSNTQARNASPSNSNQICPYISLGINSHCQIAPVKLGKENSPVSSWPHAKCLPLDSARKATSLHPKDLIGLASSNLPCSSKRQAKLFTERSVSGCWAPSWDSQPSNARRWRPSAWPARDGVLRCRNMRKNPRSRGFMADLWERVKVTRATILGLAV